MSPKLSARLTEFIDCYGRARSRAELLVEREAFGLNAGITSYTTPAQADVLANALALGPGVRVLEVGAGSGWPGLYLAEKIQAIASSFAVVGSSTDDGRRWSGRGSRRCPAAAKVIRWI